MISAQRATDIVFERDTEKRLRLISELSEDDAKELLRLISAILIEENKTPPLNI